MDKKIILGSKSPRRSELLSQAGFTCTIRTNNTDESFDCNLPVLEVAETLAKRKSDDFKDTMSDEDIVITADSVVILDNIIYNKPSDYDDGVRILRQLSGRTHIVATGVCIRTTKETESFTVLTHVTFDEILADEIHYYLETCEPFDKAGAYGIQDWLGLCKVVKIEGSYSNVMGLPMCEVYHALSKYKGNR
ncbi:MAG: septum formation protein Maf [Saprospiraceae bacterium]|nr:septum formation protein Maf [Saprospiraceae bacterium]